MEGLIAQQPFPESVAEIYSTDRLIWLADGKEMVRVPAGEFLYGDEKERVELPEYWIDKAPVTNDEYASFVAATEHAAPKDWKKQQPPKDMLDHPVVNVSWNDAVAYATWAGKDLPTEQEWEKAARGTGGRLFPWGDQEPTVQLCNFDKNVNRTTPVGKYSPQGDSPYGCVDIAGNVFEWTATDYDSGSKVLRGGSWYSDWSVVRVTDRFRGAPGHRDNDVGFRCVLRTE
jgi:formylglycine-generating enzyme required for sulfatase activity